MEKAIHTAAHRALCSHLRDLRERAGLRQVDLAERLGVPQSFVSNYENGERRLDLTELDQVTAALGADLPAVVAVYEQARNR